MTSIAPALQSGGVTLYAGDCLDILREMPDSSVDSVVTDPPYGLANTDPEHVTETLLRWVNGERDYIPGGAGFMGKAWDAFVPPVAVWDDCLRVLKPGGHVLAFAGSRTVDLMTLGLRLAGFEIRDSIAWLYGSGFPKSLDVSKAIDKAAGAERPIVGSKVGLPGYSLAPSKGSGDLHFGGFGGDGDPVREAQITAPATPDAETWQGWGTALKPAFEPVVVGRKPLVGTVAQNVTTHGTGALNIDGCRIGAEERTYSTDSGMNAQRFKHGARPADYGRGKGETATVSGRWPANVVLDESQADALDQQSGTLTSGKMKPTHTTAGRSIYGQDAAGGFTTMETYGDSGGASRFFKVAELDHRDEDPLEECPDCIAEQEPLDPVEIDRLRARFKYAAKAPKSERPRTDDGTAHPTVKPLALMRWLVRLVTPPGGVVLEPFAGSGTTVEACLLEGFRCVAIEREADYLPLIEARLARVAARPVEDLGLLAFLDDEATA